jgi:hypothetical protein
LVQAHSYLDDSLLKEFDLEIISRHTCLFIRLLLDLGFLISWKKSQILPNHQTKWDSQKLVNLVPDKSEKFPGSQRNWDMEISIRKVQFGGQHTWKNTSSDRLVILACLSDFFST